MLGELGELGELVRGNGIQKSDFSESGVGCIHYGQIHTHYGTWANETKSFVSAELASRTRRAKTGDLVIATTSENNAAVGKAVAWLGVEEVAVSTDAYIFRHRLDPRYVSYFFQTDQFQDQKHRYVTGTKVRRISGDALGKIRIPVPPLEVQREIVRVLDLFQSLEAELGAKLGAEFEARRHQYAYHRAWLLSFERLVGDGASPSNLGSGLQMNAGKSVSAATLAATADDAHRVPCFGGNGIRGYVDRPTHDGPYVLVGRQGALCGNVHRV
jgi:type I restriction enzyme, S subunit